MAFAASNRWEAPQWSVKEQTRYLLDYVGRIFVVLELLFEWVVCMNLGVYVICRGSKRSTKEIFLTTEETIRGVEKEMDSRLERAQDHEEL